MPAKRTTCPKCETKLMHGLGIGAFCPNKECDVADEIGKSETIDADDDVARLRARVETLERMDREAATYVESVICMRTGFTGNPPYVGWKGLGVAMSEAFDERDSLRAERDEAMGLLVKTKPWLGDVADLMEEHKEIGSGLARELGKEITAFLTRMAGGRGDGD